MVLSLHSGSTAVVSEKLRAPWLLLGLAAMVCAAATSLVVGPADIEISAVVRELIDRLPLVKTDSGLSLIHANIIWGVRLPRVLLGALVGATLASVALAIRLYFATRSLILTCWVLQQVRVSERQ